MRSERLRMQLMAAILAGVTALFAQLHLPFPFTPVPETGQTIGLGLAAMLLGSRYGTLSALIYLLLAAMGVQVLAGFSGGLHHFVGPTGGYIFGFPIAVFFIGYMIERRKKLGLGWALFVNIIGTLIILVMGTIQLKFVTNLTWMGAIIAGFIPFLPGAFFKSLIASAIGVVVRRRLQKIGLIKQPSTNETTA